jgi:hypothetical protein
MYFGMKNTLKSNHNHTLKQVQNKKKKEKEEEGVAGLFSNV